MKTITFSAIKGGVGKSSLAIITANALTATNKKVLFIDADLQNSSTFYYQPSSDDHSKHVANIIAGKSSLQENIVNISDKLDLIPSSIELMIERECNTSTLAEALQQASSCYDYCIIDTAPTFDNVVVSCLQASNIIISPVVTGNFDFKSTVFYSELLKQLGCDTNWKLVLNKQKSVKFTNSLHTHLLNAYVQVFDGQIIKTRVPESIHIKKYFECNTSITNSKIKRDILVVINSLVSEITAEKIELQEL